MHSMGKLMLASTQVNHSQKLNEKPCTDSMGNSLVKWQYSCCTLRLCSWNWWDMFPCCIIALGNWYWSWEQGFTDSHSQECILGYATCNQVSSICTTKSTNIDLIGKKRKSCESGATSSSSSSKKPVCEAANRCSSSMPWIHVQELSQ